MPIRYSCYVNCRGLLVFKCFYFLFFFFFFVQSHTYSDICFFFIRVTFKYGIAMFFIWKKFQLHEWGQQTSNMMRCRIDLIFQIIWLSKLYFLRWEFMWVIYLIQYYFNFVKELFSFVCSYIWIPAFPFLSHCIFGSVKQHHQKFSSVLNIVFFRFEW